LCIQLKFLGCINGLTILYINSNKKEIFLIINFTFSGESGQMGYGRQRVWGTIGFGIAALLAGYTMDLWSRGEIYKTYTPAFLLVLVFTSIDLICCTKLEVIILWTKKKEMNNSTEFSSCEFHLTLYILITATAYVRIVKHIKRYMHPFDIKTYRYIFMFCYPCGHPW